MTNHTHHYHSLPSFTTAHPTSQLQLLPTASMFSMETDPDGQGNSQPPMGKPYSGGPQQKLNIAMDVGNSPGQWTWDNTNQCILHSAHCPTCNNSSTHQHKAHLLHESNFVDTVAKCNKDSIPHDQYNRMKAKLGNKISDLYHEHNGLWHQRMPNGMRRSFKLLSQKSLSGMNPALCYDLPFLCTISHPDYSSPLSCFIFPIDMDF